MKNSVDNSILFKRILLVEDHPETVAEIHDFLDLHFFEVTAVATGPEAIQRLLKQKFDVIVCDLTIPHLPREMFFHAVERICPHLGNRIVTISDASTSRSARNLGTVCIWKPIDPQILLEAIKGVLSRTDRVARPEQQSAAA